MEKNVYEIIQDWHELLKNGIISEDEFITKKKELLGNEEAKNANVETEILVESYSDNQNNYHENIYEEDNFISKYRALIALCILCLIILGSYYYKYIDVKPTENIIQENIDNSNNENEPYGFYQKIMNSYYSQLKEHQCEKIPSFFSEKIDTFFSKKNATKNDVLNECNNYQNRFPYFDYELNEYSFNVDNTDEKNVIVKYDLIVRLKKNENGNWKIYNLTLTAIFDENNKIKSITEIKR